MSENETFPKKIFTLQVVQNRDYDSPKQKNIAP